MDGSDKGIVIVGGGLAGDACVTELRRKGFSGRITVIGDENWRPYERPPLSKSALLAPDLIRDSFCLKPEGWYRDNSVEMVLGSRVTDIDLHDRKLNTDTGDRFSFDRLLLATGGDVRRLGSGSPDEAVNLSYLRTKDDAFRLASQLSEGVRLVIVGMGVIGCELASTARRLGCEVRAIEPAPIPMGRALGTGIGRWLATVHEENGVEVSYGRSFRRFVMDGRRIRAVECDDGSMLECDVVCVGIGVVPRTELAASAGLLVDDGIVVDSSNRTQCDFVYAAGDVARVPASGGGTVRYETYQNAADQGSIAAGAMLGEQLRAPLPCSFWTDQYDLNIQIVGTVSDDLTTVRRSLAKGGFAQFYLLGGIVAGCVAINPGRDFTLIRRMVISGTNSDPERLADPGVPLKEILG